MNLTIRSNLRKRERERESDVNKPHALKMHTENQNLHVLYRENLKQKNQHPDSATVGLL